MVRPKLYKLQLIGHTGHVLGDLELDMCRFVNAPPSQAEFIVPISYVTHTNCILHFNVTFPSAGNSCALLPNMI